MPRGGARRNSGPKKGAIYAPTVIKEAARVALRDLILEHMPSMTKAQIAAAKGIDHFILRDPKSGKFERVTDPERIVEALNAENAEQGSTFYIHTKDPSTPAYTDLLNRAIDKPAEQEQAVKIEGKLEIFWRGKAPKD